MKIGISEILTAFNDKTIGSKVIDKENFINDLEGEVLKTDFSSFRVPGQAYIELPKHFCKYVSVGIGKRSLYPEDYVARLYRGKVGLYLKRQFATDVKEVSVVIYEKEAYINDPDISDSEKEWAIYRTDITHMLVAVLASSGFKSPLTPYRFVHNLAGGNNEAKKWSADEIRDMAKQIIKYSNEWCIVAD